MIDYQIHPSIMAEMPAPAPQPTVSDLPAMPELPEDQHALQQADTPAVEANEQSTINQEPQTDIGRAIDEDKTFRAFKELREARNRAERERDELHRKMLEAERSRQQAQEPDELAELLQGSDDDLVERKHLKKLVERLESKMVINQKLTQESMIEAQLRAQFPDFDQIVSAQNVQRFAQENPEMAEVINSSPDMYKKAVTVYKQIKRMGTVSDPVVESEKQRILANASKPRAVSSISPQRTTSNLQHADSFSKGLTPDLQKQLLAEMREAIKNR